MNRTFTKPCAHLGTNSCCSTAIETYTQIWRGKSWLFVCLRESLAVSRSMQMFEHKTDIRNKCGRIKEDDRKSRGRPSFTATRYKSDKNHICFVFLSRIKAGTPFLHAAVLYPCLFYTGIKNIYKIEKTKEGAKKRRLPIFAFLKTIKTIDKRNKNLTAIK